ncbi:MAG: galactokinase [Acidobacteria bacterium]|nr:MAG: galactokinase [Acidobacteriota bacterium]
MITFESLFHAHPEIETNAHGRVNLIGEHTDYNNGYVLPAQIPQHTIVQMRKRNDLRARLFSENKDPVIEEYVIGKEQSGRGWIDYIQGLTKILTKDRLELSGFDAFIRSTVPEGTGVSSSAALEVSILCAFQSLFALPLDPVGIAKTGQLAENEFVGAHVGIMDQMAASVGDQHSALFLDTQSMEYKKIPLPPSVALIVIHSGITHENRGGEYNLRRQECEDAAKLLRVRSLRELTMEDLPRINTLPAPLNMRARHVITENERVLEAVVALEKEDLVTLGKLFNSSHISMRDDYQVSLPEIDHLVKIAQSNPEVYGARLTGGGFGGCVVIAAKQINGRKVAVDVAAEYARATNRTPQVLLP